MHGVPYTAAGRFVLMALPNLSTTERFAVLWDFTEAIGSKASSVSVSRISICSLTA